MSCKQQNREQDIPRQPKSREVRERDSNDATRVARYLWYFHIALAFTPPPHAAPPSHTVEPPTRAWMTIHATVISPNVYTSHEGTVNSREAAGAYTVPSRKMRRIVAILLQDDGKPSQEDQGDPGTDHGDLVPLETCSLCVGLGGGLERQNACDKAGRRNANYAVEVLTVREAADGQGLQQRVEREPTQGARVVA